jgi:hypothetical protein
MINYLLSQLDLSTLIVVVSLLTLAAVYIVILIYLRRRWKTINPPRYHYHDDSDAQMRCDFRNTRKPGE